jgi:PAS domain S-box-containing protein
MGQDVEIILLKQLASCLRMPIAVVDPNATAIYFNEPAEAIFGLRFEETGGLSAEEWVSILQPSDEDHVPLKDEQRPLAVALSRRQPAHRRVIVRRNDGVRSPIEVTAVPLTATGDRFLGALSLFWRPDDPAAGPHAAPAPSSEPHAVETILTRRLASRWTAPIFLVDAAGGLLYFNPAAETILGRAFDETSLPGTRRELYAAFQPRRDDGTPIDPRDHPLALARIRGQPVHDVTRMRGLDGRDRRIEITAIPLIGQSDRLLGAFGVFWESPSP